MNRKIIFESKRIKFINISKDFIHDYLEMINDKDIAKYLSLKEKKYTYDEELEWINKKLENNAIVFSMIEKETEEFIGNIELISSDGENELAIVINKKMQGKGYGTEAIKAFINYLFNTFNFDRFILSVFSENKRAIDCYKYIGFKEFKRKKSVGIIDNKEVDDIYMEIKIEEVSLWLQMNLITTCQRS